MIVSILRRAFVWILLVLAVVVVRVWWFTAPRVVRGDPASIERRLAEELGDARLGSAALVLMHRGEIGHVHTFGDRSGEVYQVASVSKAVTAFGVMKLVQEGKLRLDEPVKHYRERVTVRQLLSHTAGLDDSRRDGDFAPVAHAPGTTLSYSTGGYHVLQLVVEEATGEPFARWMKANVLQPLGMTTASFDPRECRPRLAPAFDGDLVRQPPRDFTTLAGVALCASANDLARFARAFVEENLVLTRATLRQMMEPQPGTSGTWGLGLTLFAPGVVGHDGGTPPAWGGLVRVNPATGDGMALVVSGGRGAVNQLGHDWVYWETGQVTRAARREHAVRQVVPAVVAVLVGLIVIVLWTFLRRARTAVLLLGIGLTLSVVGEPSKPVFVYASLSGQPTFDEDDYGGNPFATAMVCLLARPSMTFTSFQTDLIALTQAASGGRQQPEIVGGEHLSRWQFLPKPAKQTWIALVVVFWDYPGVRSLPGARHDLHRVVTALSEAGFAVAGLSDPQPEALQRALDDFGRRSASADVAVIYTTGHGVEVGGIARILRPHAGRVEPALTVPELASAARAKRANLIFYAACRNREDR